MNGNCATNMRNNVSINSIKNSSVINVQGRRKTGNLAITSNYRAGRFASLAFYDSTCTVIHKPLLELLLRL